MLPGKTYTPEDFVWIAWSRKWFILVPAVVISIGTFLWARSLPDRYQSSATVLVIGQQVPKDLIRPTVTDSVEDRLRAISQEILSRTKLERIIDEFGLYKKERGDRIMEDIIEQMRTRDLVINIPRTRGDTTSFSVSFTAEKPRIAMQVADRLASLFVKANTENRELQAGSTSQFLDDQLEKARRAMKDQDDKIAAFRLQHSGRLPEQLQSNIQMVMTTQAQIESNVEAAGKARDRISQLENKIADLEALVNAAAAANAAASPGADSPTAKQLEATRAHRTELLLTRKEDHPDIRKIDREIAALEARAESEAQNAPVSPAPVVPTLRAADQDKLIGWRDELRELRADLERRAKEDTKLHQQLAQYSGRMESTPGVESEFTDLMRNYGTQREQYEELLKKRDSSKLAENLERQQIGEKFSVIDSARLPERPVWPDRTRYNLMGIFGGLAFGIALAALLEYRDTTLKSDDDVVTSLSLPVLAVIPAMTNVVERTRQRRRTRLMLLATSIGSVLLVAAAVAWKYRIIQDWIR
jgi:polysaccharide chain length determinant protein (PEP-CTERM system associated)